MISGPIYSLIIPVHNESGNIVWHHEKIVRFLTVNNLNYEILYINDGSSDDSIEQIKLVAKDDNAVRYVSFSRNFGKEAATTAGLRRARGDAAIVIDADGQHPIETVAEFIKKWQQGAQVVIGIRQNDKGGGIVKTLGSHLFYAFLRFLGNNTSSQTGLTDFRLLDRKVIDEFNKLTEHNRVSRNLIDWLGFRRELVPFQAEERHAGTASYSFRKLFKLAVDGIVKHSTRPLKFIGLAGFMISFISLFAGLFMIIEQYALGDPMGLGITGTAVLATFLSFMIGIVLFCQGLLALYLENVYYETQNRPLYIIDEEV